MKHQRNHELKLEKVIKKPVKDVYRALAEGRLFMNCGADSEDMEIDFRVGGKYRIDFKHYDLTNLGEFLEIVPNRKIVFSWCSSFDEPLTPDTTVTIELFPEGEKTRVLLMHAGFGTIDSCDAHKGGWTSGLDDMANEVEEGKLRMLRVYASPVTKLFETCLERMVKGQPVEKVANKKVVFNLDATRVTLTFDDEDDGASSVAIFQEGLTTAELQRSQRKHWQEITNAMFETLGKNV